MKADTDKYTAKTALEQEQGYFIRVKAGQKIEAPLQACVLSVTRSSCSVFITLLL